MIWSESKDDFPFFTGVTAIVASWFISPVLSGICAATLFLIVRYFVLRRENAFDRAFIVYPILVFLTVLINSFFILFKGASGLGLDDTPLAIALPLALVISLISAVIIYFMLPWFRKRVIAMYEGKTYADDEAEKRTMVLAPDIVSPGGSPGTGRMKAAMKLYNDEGEEIKVERELVTPWYKIKHFASRGVEYDVHAVIAEDPNLQRMYNKVEKFDDKTEIVFQYLQILTATADSFSHGANDVANSIGPFSTMYTIWSTGVITSDENDELDLDIYWILALGGIGITCGLAFFGYNIIEGIGVRLTPITPSRGFAIELGAAFIILMGSRYGIPLSTTHCQVGATVFVGMVDGKNGSEEEGGVVDCFAFFRTCIAWAITPICVGALSAMFFAQGGFAPQINCDLDNVFLAEL